MTVYYDKERNRWRYNFRHQGKRYSGYCIHPKTQALAGNKTEARAVEDIIRGKLKEQPAAVPSVRHYYTLAEAMAAYYKRKQGRIDLRDSKKMSPEILAFFGTDCDLKKVKERLPEYLDFACKQKIRVFMGKDVEGNRKFKETDRFRSPAQVNNYIAFLGRVVRAFRKSLPEDQRPLVPEDLEPDYLKTPKRLPTPLYLSDMKKILDELDPVEHAHLRLGFLLAINTGMRESEITDIRDKQYIQEVRLIILDTQQTKSDAARPIYISDLVHEILMECRARGDSLWQALENNPGLQAEYSQKYGIESRGDIPFILYQPRGKNELRPVRKLWARAWREARERAGVSKRGHDTRGGFVTDLLSDNTDLMSTKELAGHQNIQTTMIYARAANSNMRDAVERQGKRMAEMMELHTKVAHRKDTTASENIITLKSLKKNGGRGRD